LFLTLIGQGSQSDNFVVFQLRLPRTAMAVVAGAAFAISGGLFQSLLRNPLASPDVIGITQGASFAAVTAILVFGLSGLGVSLAAFAGAIVVAAAIYLLSWRSGLTGYRFVLVGIGFAFMIQAAVGYLLTRSDVREAQAALVWMVGSLSGVRWVDVVIAGACIGVLLPLAWFVSTRLRVLELGDDTAIGLGLPTNRVRLGILFVAVAFAAVGTAAIGPVAFVAFVSAPIARRALRTGGLALAPSALVGVLLVLAADFVAQHLLPGEAQVPVGIITGIVGAPYLLWLLVRSNRLPGVTDA
jgi:iron complex transport system permease protein